MANVPTRFAKAWFEVDGDLTQGKFVFLPAEGDNELRCIVECAKWADQLVRFLTACKATPLPTDDSYAPQFHENSLYFVLPCINGDLRATITHYRQALDRCGTTPLPTIYRMGYDDAEVVGIEFEETDTAWVIVRPDCLEHEQLPSWVDSVRKSGLVEEITPTACLYEFMLLLTTEARSEDEQLTTYLRIAELLMQLVDDAEILAINEGHNKNGN